MNNTLSALVGFWWVIPLVVAMVFWKAVARLFGVVMVPEDQTAIVTKKFRVFGKNISLPDGRVIATQGEAGLQAQMLPPGLHLWFWPWQFGIDLVNLTTIPEGQVGVVEAIDGEQIPKGRVFATTVDCDSYQSADGFLANGGQRGPQLEVLRPGSYRINTRLFKVRLEKALQVAPNTVALITTLDGRSLPPGEIAGPSPTVDHQAFQDAQKFIDGGGYKGRQEQVLLAGTYYLNPDFIKVELTQLTEVPIGHVGVVVAYMGQEPASRAGGTGDKHANIVPKGFKGVWAEALDPGKYAINTYTHKVELVPTTNIVLNWASAKSEAHTLDSNLSTITVRSADGFSFNLDVSQIIHVSPDDASKVIARFGSMKNLVTQVLEPLIGNYFRNSAQEADILTFLRQRAEQQQKAKDCIDGALAQYAVQAVDTLIGDISPPAELMKTLTDRKVAEQQEATFAQQQKAEVARQTFEQEKSRADTMPNVVTAARNVEISKLDAESRVEKAKGEAESKTIQAKADAEVITVTSKAQAEATMSVGTAEAEVLQKKVTAVGQEGYTAMQITDYLSDAKMQLVPQVLVSSGSHGGGSMVDALLGMYVRDSLSREAASPPANQDSPALPSPESVSAPSQRRRVVSERPATN